MIQLQDSMLTGNTIGTVDDGGGTKMMDAFKL